MRVSRIDSIDRFIQSSAKPLYERDLLQKHVDVRLKPPRQPVPVLSSPVLRAFCVTKFSKRKASAEIGLSHQSDRDARQYFQRSRRQIRLSCRGAQKPALPPVLPRPYAA